MKAPDLQFLNTVLVTMSSACVAFDASKSDTSGFGSAALAIVLPPYDASSENLFGPKDSVHDRFPFDGKPLWEALRRHYFEKPSPQAFVASDYTVATLWHCLCDLL